MSTRLLGSRIVSWVRVWRLGGRLMLELTFTRMPWWIWGRRIARWSCRKRSLSCRRYWKVLPGSRSRASKLFRIRWVSCRTRKRGRMRIVQYLTWIRVMPRRGQWARWLMDRVLERMPQNSRGRLIRTLKATWIKNSNSRTTNSLNSSVIILTTMVASQIALLFCLMPSSVLLTSNLNKLGLNRSPR